jgi:hypothetical protein
LKIEPPLTAHVNLKGNFEEDRLSRKRSKMLEKLQPQIEVFERKELKNADTESQGEALVKVEPNKGEPALFIGLPKNEDAVTKLLITKKEILRLK